MMNEGHLFQLMVVKISQTICLWKLLVFNCKREISYVKVKSKVKDRKCWYNLITISKMHLYVWGSMKIYWRVLIRVKRNVTNGWKDGRKLENHYKILRFQNHMHTIINFFKVFLQLDIRFQIALIDITFQNSFDKNSN